MVTQDQQETFLKQMLTAAILQQQSPYYDKIWMTYIYVPTHSKGPVIQLYCSVWGI